MKLVKKVTMALENSEDIIKYLKTLDEIPHRRQIQSVEETGLFHSILEMNLGCIYVIDDIQLIYFVLCMISTILHEIEGADRTPGGLNIAT